MSSSLAHELGLSAIERDIERILNTTTRSAPKHMSIASIDLPETTLSKKATEYARLTLDPSAFNHSNRVYYIGAIVAKDQFPEWKWDSETYFLTSILHDIALGKQYQEETVLSFEYYGGILAREFILKEGGSRIQADTVAEGIFRHTNFVSGKISVNGQMIQLSTTLDVIGANPQLYHPASLAEIVGTFPRLGWNNHMADLMVKEEDLKPHSHTTCLDASNFIEKIRSNEVMKGWDMEYAGN